MSRIFRHQDLEVYRKSFAAAMTVFEITRSFPREETFSLTDQLRRSSRSVCANLAEAWRRRRYEAAFVSKLNECQGEAAETQTWIEFAVRCGYLAPNDGRAVFRVYDEILSMIVAMENSPHKWVLPSGLKKRGR